MYELREILDTFRMWEQKGNYSEGERNILRACINEVKASIEKLQETEEIKSARRKLEEAFDKLTSFYETHGIAYMREDESKPFEPVAVCKE
jgi:hypothetical protein